ncbi:MAG: cytochrome c family protein [Deltaproteobacteria bacterium]|nr:cytochrome c family protein [Deltaproteobacteria bacterium]
MTRRVRIAAAAVAAYAASYALVAGWRALRSRENPHDFMRDPSRCRECHIEKTPEPGRPYKLMNFRADIYTLCSRCHPRPVSHPVDIAPGKGMTKDLPLDPDGTMTCITCHAPHGPHLSSQIHTGRSTCEKIRDAVFPGFPRRFRTYYLRVPTPEGELCKACHARKPMAAGPGRALPDLSRYAGSAACGGCHGREYRLWRRTPHARMVRSPRKEPGALLARFEGETPFPPSEIVYVLGSRNVQRFVSLKQGNLVVRTPIWIIRPGSWNLSYWREMDWLRSCAGCHMTAFDPFTGRSLEEGVGCEACHGPGRAHARSRRPEEIVHPGKIGARRRAMICESCHTTGHDATGEFRFPVGFLPGLDLRRFYFGLIPKPGQDDRSFRGDGTYEDRHAQFLFWESNMLLRQGETCDLCKNFRMAREEAAASEDPRMSSREFCRSCHDGAVLPPPPHHGGPVTRRAHCLSCHPPARAASGEVSIHDHRFIPRAAMPRNDFIPPPDFNSICFRCHPAPTKGA